MISVAAHLLEQVLRANFIFLEFIKNPLRLVGFIVSASGYRLSHMVKIQDVYRCKVIESTENRIDLLRFAASASFSLRP